MDLSDLHQDCYQLSAPFLFTQMLVRDPVPGLLTYPGFVFLCSNNHGSDKRKIAFLTS